MNYEIEELVPIVGKLAEKYTDNESTSITYEKAQQLMGRCCTVSMRQKGKDRICRPGGRKFRPGRCMT